MTEGNTFLASVQAFANQQVAHSAARWSQGHVPDPDIFKAAARLGLFGIELPVHAGGLGLDFRHKAEACRILDQLVYLALNFFAESRHRQVGDVLGLDVLDNRTIRA